MAKFGPQAELPVSEQAQIRREKLLALQAEGEKFMVIAPAGSYEMKLLKISRD